MDDWTQYLRFFVTLTAVVDPFLAVPFFIAFTLDDTPAQRARLARTVAVTVLCVLAGSALFGEALLRMIGASLAAFRVGGGLVLLLMALAMLNAELGRVRQNPVEAAELRAGEVRGVVPLAVPLLAGPGAISTAIIASEQRGLLDLGLLVLVIGLVAALTWLTLSRAHLIASRLSNTALNVGTRLLGLLLAAMAVQTMAEGLVSLFPGLSG
ncbi:MAG: NAAT family transporter [Rhodocyclaceae bacterium]|nr:NAAT family transporter [Rhodocyclaceae bacterium]